MGNKKKLAGGGILAAFIGYLAWRFWPRKELPPEPEPASVWGYITDTKTALAVGDVKISLMDTDVVVYSDVIGRYEVPDLVTGNIYGLRFERDGYAPYELRWIVPEAGENKINVSLTPIPMIVPVEFVSLEPSEFSWSQVIEHCRTVGLLGAVVPRCLYMPEAAGFGYQYWLYIKIPEDNPYFDPSYPVMSIMKSYHSHNVCKSFAELPPGIEYFIEGYIIEPGIHDMPFLRPYFGQLMRFPDVLTGGTWIGEMYQTGPKITPQWKLVESPADLLGTYDLYLSMIQGAVVFGTDSYGHLEVWDGNWFRLIIKDLPIGTIHLDI